MAHKFDEDAICEYCGFDGAEWWHWKHNTYEGKSSDAKQPECLQNNFQTEPNSPVAETK